MAKALLDTELLKRLRYFSLLPAAGWRQRGCWRPRGQSCRGAAQMSQDCEIIRQATIIATSIGHGLAPR